MAHQVTNEGWTTTTATRKRRKPHTPVLWARIQPLVKQYYIDQDMTLDETMRKLSIEHGFHATEQMYKRRLKTWNYTKQVKSDVKEKILEKLLHDEPVSGDLVIMSRPDKLWRYAKSRIKSGTLDSEHLNRIAKRYAVVPITVPQVDSIPNSPALPGQFAQFDLFLRAMQAVIERERHEYFASCPSPPDTIYKALSTGMALWRRNDFAAARHSFGQAAHKTMEDLQGACVSVSRIAYCISSILWGAERSPVFQQFAKFMVNAALEVLGSDSPLTIVLQYIRHEHSLHVQLRIWESSMHGYRLAQDNRAHWWDMARRRWQWCWRSGNLHLAARYCDQAVREARAVGQLSLDMEMEAQTDVGKILLESEELGSCSNS